MSDHNFEKRIQQKLGELKIPPADTVWSSVEAQIRKDKRRRRGVILLPLLFLLIGTCVYFIFQNNLRTNNSGSKYLSTKSTSDNGNNSTLSNSTSEDQKKEPELTKKSNSQNNETTVTKQPTLEKRQQQQAVVTKTSENNGERKKAGNDAIARNTVTSKSGTGATKKSNDKLTIAKNTRSADIKRTAQDQDIDIIDNGKKTDRHFRQNKQSITPDTKRPSTDTQKKEEELIAKNKQQEEERISKDSEKISVPDSQVAKIEANVHDSRLVDSAGVHDLTQLKPTDSASTAPIVAEKKTAVKKIKQSKWKWGLSGSAGISNLNDESFFEGIFDGISGEKALVADVSPNSFNNTPGNVSPTAVIYKPSAIEKGFSFSVGTFVQRNLSRRFSISTGLQYSYYSTKIRVGKRVDSSTFLLNTFGMLNVSQIYRSAPSPTTTEYTNRYHFIELPVAVHTRLNKSNRMPILWNAGLSLSYLVSTNALHFDSQTGVYYKHNGLFNKLQANLSTGFSISLWNASRMPVDIGPQLQYGLTNLMKQETAAGKHLFYLGLNTRVFLKK